MIRIPAKFYDDHKYRDLDTPVAIKRSKRHVWISPDDPYVSELLSDAHYYSDPTGFDPYYRGLCASAAATVRALTYRVN